MGKKSKGKKRNDEFEMDESFDGGGSSEVFDSPVPYPMKLEREYVATVDDETLHNIARSIQDSINKVSKMNLNPYPWEIEMCYLQQEMQVRSTRRARHSEWLSTLPPVEME